MHAPYTTTYATEGMVCTGERLASVAGVAMLRAGGGAVDAAIAANAVLTVTHQHQCGLGGDAFALVYRPGDREPAVLNASGRAGSGADPDRLRRGGRVRMPERGEVSVVPVPGCVDGWLALHERFGRLALTEILEPARVYAERGFPASPTLAAAVAALPRIPAAADYEEAGPLRAGSIVRRPGPARALAAIALHGRAGFYQGEFGERLLELGAGEYTVSDLARSNADWVEPLGVDVWGRRLWTVPPNSQGYLTLSSAWIAERLSLPADPESPRWPHLLVEAARQAAFDRDEVLHEGADGVALLAPERLAPRAAAVDPDRAGAPGGATRRGGTAFLCAADAGGMGVSLIQSNYMGFGSHLVVPGLGIFLQNRGAAFSLEPGHPTEYGPGRRPPHTLSPALVTRADGTLDCLVGTMGGDSQPQTLLQLLARHLVADEGPAETIAAPRFVLARGAQVVLEGHAPDAWLRGLTERGHAVATEPSWASTFGHAHLIVREGDLLAGASDPRALGGAALGY